MEGCWTLLLFLGAYLVLLAAETRLITGKGIYTNTWAVHIEVGAEEAERIAHKHGFISHGQVSAIKDLSLVSCKSCYVCVCGHNAA
uniref:Peptidase S8 pro-domain domain-containing protein n=1 Tax=Cyprinus carpio TaxID=7962 RepID=A0A8C2JJS5_CYPCA